MQVRETIALAQDICSRRINPEQVLPRIAFPEFTILPIHADCVRISDSRVRELPDNIPQQIKLQGGGTAGGRHPKRSIIRINIKLNSKSGIPIRTIKLG